MKIAQRFILLSTLLFSMLQAEEEPKLVVAISLDQFPYEYIAKYRQHFAKGGFAYLLDNGADFVNCLYLHAATKTGPGHAVILSGSYGNVNGIIENSWLDRSSNTELYCVEDRSVSIVGMKGGSGRSPRNFIGATFGDQLKIRSNFQAKVISVSNKDRAAILMGGRLADAAYWSEDSLFVTSTYYRQDLPEWVQHFNRSGWYRSFFGKEWKLLLPESEYRRIGPDDGVGESDYYGGGPRFPHRFDGGDPGKMTKAYSYALLTSPFGAEVLEEFAEEAVKAERLGLRGVTDLLCVGISSTDYAGHAFGPQSWEMMDMTLRMDRLLEKFFAFLDSTVGIANCVIVLTSDHGVSPIPELLTKIRPDIDAGRVAENQLLSPAVKALESQYGRLSSDSVWLRVIEGGNIYLEEKALEEKGVERDRAARIVQEALSALPFVAAAFTQSDLSQSAVSGSLAEAVRYSYFPTRSGDVLVVLKPYYFPGDPRYPAGTTHGSPYSYDAHVPLLIAGPRIVPGKYYDRVSPADIAPTLSALLGVELPPRVQGRILHEAMKEKRGVD